MAQGLLAERYSIVNNALVCQAAAPRPTQVADGVRDVHFEFGVGKQGDTLAQPWSRSKPRCPQRQKPSALPAGRALRTGKVTQGMESTICTRWTQAGGPAASCDASAGQLLQLVTGSLTLRNLMP